MKVRYMKHLAPRPKAYMLSASVAVPEFDGPFGWPMTTVRVTVKGSCQTGDPDWRVCMRHLAAARDRYLASIPAASAQEVDRG